MSKQGIYILICAQTKMCFSILKLHKNIFLPPCLLIFIQKDLQWIQRVAHKQGQRYELHVQCFSKILWESWINLLRKKKNNTIKITKLKNDPLWKWLNSTAGPITVKTNADMPHLDQSQKTSWPCCCMVQKHFVSIWPGTTDYWRDQLQST